jgi:DNA-binding response OmpR family regulator
MPIAGERFPQLPNLRQSKNDKSMTTLLIVEDEKTVREMLAQHFEAEGFNVLSAADGVKGLTLAREKNPDLIVLDLMLPEMDGLSVCRVLRKESDVPVIMLTARGTEMDKIVGLETGADDYVVKPFSFGELLARVRANLRRVDRESRQARTRLQSGDLQLDLIARRAYRGQAEIRLTPKEFDLLAELMRNKGAALSRDLLLTQVWGYDYPGDSHTVDVHIRWLREKVEDDPSRPARIKTVRGVGYRFEE